MDKINKNYCNNKCLSGPAGKSIGYYSYGTCLDWAYDEIKVDYVFAWEIYQGGKDIRNKERNKEKYNFGMKNFLKNQSFI